MSENISRCFEGEFYYLLLLEPSCFIEADLKGAQGGAPCLFFCNHFAEVEIMLFEVELIINNAPLKHVYPNSKKTFIKETPIIFYLTDSYSNTTATVATNLTVLSSTTDKIN